MTQKAKTILLGVLGFSALLATIGGSLFLARKANAKDAATSSTIPVSSDSGDTPSAPIDDNPTTPSDPSSNPNQEQRDGPYITCDKTAMTLQVDINDTEMPSGYFTPTIFNPDPDDGPNAAKHLAVCCPSDPSFTEWLDFWTVDAQDHATYAVSQTGGVIVFSGNRVKVKMKKKPSIAGGYQLRLRVYSPYYDSSTVRSFLDVDLRTVR